MSDYNKAYHSSLSRRNDLGDGLDFWATPPQATQALFDKEEFYGNILEPCCGTGDMAEIILKNSKNGLICSDIVDRGYYRQTIQEDFLESTIQTNIDNVITNPPFNLAKEFVSKALEISSYKVAMLLKLEFLQSQKRTKWFKSSPLKWVYIFEYRVPFWKQGYKQPINNQRHAWYVWEKGYEGNPMIDWIEKPNDGLDRYWWK